MTLVLIAVLVLMWLYVSRLQARIEHIEKYLQETTRLSPEEGREGAPGLYSISQAEDKKELGTQPEGRKAIASSRPGASTEPTIIDSFIAWCKKDWLLKVGALLVLMGCGWFVSYAIVQGWLSPAMRIILGVALGGLLLIFGYLRLRIRRIEQGEVFVVLGAVIVLLTVFAGQTLYELLVPWLALMVMFVASALVGLASAIYNRRSLALLGLVLANIAPYLTNAPDASMLGLFSYLFVVSLGMVWVVYVRGWYILSPIALGLVIVHSIPWLSGIVAEPSQLGSMLIIFGFASLFFIVSTFGILKRDDDTKAVLTYTATAGLVGLLLVLWILYAAVESQQIILLLLWAATFLAVGEYVYRTTNRLIPLGVYSGVSTVLVACATAVAFDGPALTLAYTFEAGVVVALVYILSKRASYTKLASLVFAVPLLLSLESIFAPTWKEGIWHSDFVVLGALIAVSLALVTMCKYGVHVKDARDRLELIIAFSGIATAYTFLLTWLSLESYGHGLVTGLIALETFVLVGLVMLATRDRQTIVSVSMVFAIPLLLSIQSIVSDAWNSGIYHYDFFALLVLPDALLGTAILTYWFLQEKRSTWELPSVTFGYTIIGSAMAYILLWKSLHALMPFAQDTATMIALVIYTCIGVVTYVLGRLHASSQLLMYGGVLVMLVVARLLIVDVWTMELIGRVATFMLIGALLMSATFVYSKDKKEKVY